MGFFTYLLAFACVSVISAQLKLPSKLPTHCAAVICPQPNCLGAITPPGQCCPICPGQEKPGRCPQVRRRWGGVCAQRCSSDYNCPGRQKCCSNGCDRSCRRPVGGGRPNCALVDCRPLRCVNQYTPRGRCCPVCRPPGNTDCTHVPCAAVHCVGQYTPRGQCCPICPRTGY